MESDSGGILRRLKSRATLINYLLLTFPAWIVALTLRAVVHSDTPYYVWAALWGIPALGMLVARWLYFVGTLMATIITAIFHAILRIVRPK